MRLNKIICPKCTASLMSKTGIEVGTALACPKCQHKFKAATLEDEEIFDDFEIVDDEEDEAPKKPARPAMKKRVADDEDEEEQKPRPKRRVVKDDDDEEDERPRAKRRVVKDDDEEDEEKPRPKRRLRDDDDDDERPLAKKRKRDDENEADRPRKKKRKRRRGEDLGIFSKLMSNISVWVAALGVLLAVIGISMYSSMVKYNAKVQVELEKFQGTWTVVSMGKDNIQAPAEWLKLTYTFKSDQYTAKFDQKVEVGTITLRLGKSPAQFSMNTKKGPIVDGIYRFNDDKTLEICINEGNRGARPTTFSTSKGSFHILIVMRRE